jgi:hypothetical protein
VGSEPVGLINEQAGGFRRLLLAPVNELEEASVPNRIDVVVAVRL